MDLIDDPESDDPHARLSTLKVVYKRYMSPVIAAAEMFHEGGPTHPAKAVQPIRQSASHRFHTDGKAPSGSPSVGRLC